MLSHVMSDALSFEVLQIPNENKLFSCIFEPFSFQCYRFYIVHISKCWQLSIVSPNSVWMRWYVASLPNYLLFSADRWSNNPRKFVRGKYFFFNPHGDFVQSPTRKSDLFNKVVIWTRLNCFKWLVASLFPKKKTFSNSFDFFSIAIFETHKQNICDVY